MIRATNGAQRRAPTSFFREPFGRASPANPLVLVQRERNQDQQAHARAIAHVHRTTIRQHEASDAEFGDRRLERVAGLPPSRCRGMGITGKVSNELDKLEDMLGNPSSYLNVHAISTLYCGLSYPLKAIRHDRESATIVSGANLMARAARHVGGEP